MSHLHSILLGGLSYVTSVMAFSLVYTTPPAFHVVCRLMLLAILCGGMLIGWLTRNRPLTASATFGGIMVLVSLPLYNLCFAPLSQVINIASGPNCMAALSAAVPLSCVSAILGASIGICANPFASNRPH